MDPSVLFWCASHRVYLRAVLAGDLGRAWPGGATERVDGACGR